MWTAAALAVGLWLPPSLSTLAMWPAATAMAIAVVWYFANILKVSPRSATSTPDSIRSAVAAVSALIAMGLATWTLPIAWSQGGDNNIVLVLPGPAEAPDRQDVLVTPDLLKRLAKMADRGPSGLRGAVLTAANYDGQMTGDVAQLKGEFQIHCFGDKATLTIPLAGVELREGALLDGASVFPTATPAGYVLAVNGKGGHKLTLPFAVRPKTTPEHRDLQFTVPRLFQSKLHLRMSAAWSAPLALTGMGGVQSAALDEQFQEVTVELGREAAVHLRWPSANPPSTLSKATVHEAYFFDLGNPAATCTAVLNYSVPAPGVAKFSIALPDALEPRDVEVTGEGIEGEGDDALQPRLRDWRFGAEDGQWRLHVQLQAPAAGNVNVTLHLIPRGKLRPVATRLPLPVPMGVKSTGGVLGYRIEGFDSAESAENLNTVPLSPEQFAEQWQENGAASAVLPTRAVGFGERNGESALLVVLSPRPTAFDQDLRWTLFPSRSDLAAKLQVTTLGDELTLIQWAVPAQIVVAEVSGDNVRAWTRSTGPARVQVWLKQPAQCHRQPARLDAASGIGAGHAHALGDADAERCWPGQVTDRCPRCRGGERPCRSRSEEVCESDRVAAAGDVGLGL